VPLLLLVALLLTLPATVLAQGGDRPTVTELGWLESFLMTEEERRAAIQAMTHGDREAFRRLFWMRRDPDPSTPENETLDLYLARVRLAHSNFSEDGGYGGGDRARVFVLLGMPVQVLPQPATEEAPEGLLWVFPPEPKDGLEDTLEARYLRDEEGQLWLENRTEVDESLEEMRRRLVTRPEIGFERDESGQLAIPNLPAGGSERARQVLAGLSAGASAAGFAFRVTPAYFRVADRATYVALLFETASEALTPGIDGQLAASVFAKTASAEEEGPGAATYRLETAHTSIQAAEGSTRFEASLILPPGTHRLLLGVVDEQSEAFGTAQLEIEAPAFPETEPRFSSVVLYSDTTMQEFSGIAPGRAFQFGRTHFEPRSTGVFRQEETLGAFYFFYPGERVDDGELPEIVAEYTLSREGQDTGFVRPEALPTSTRQAAANAEFELRDFAPGRYELGIRVLYGEQVFETQKAFTLVR
jgi:GWxTD domain-containing protein